MVVVTAPRMKLICTCFRREKTLASPVVGSCSEKHEKGMGRPRPRQEVSAALLTSGLSVSRNTPHQVHL